MFCFFKKLPSCLDSGYEECSMLAGPSNSELKRSYSECEAGSRKWKDNANEISNSHNTANLLAECPSNQVASFLDNMDDKNFMMPLEVYLDGIHV